MKTHKQGLVLLPWLFILLMIGSLLWLLQQLRTGVEQTDGCKANLERIYAALRQYEGENGRLPTFELYPADARMNEDSMLNVLAKQPGFDVNNLICPSAPDVLREPGITYLWNTALNQSSLTDREEITWVLVDMHALDDSLPGPHFGQVHILYTDGHVERTDKPPPGLPLRF